MESLEFPNLLSHRVHGIENIIENSNKEVDEENIGDEQEHRHGGGGYPVAGGAGGDRQTGIVVYVAHRVDLAREHFSVKHEVWLQD